jgi:prepilin-type N-terminal cleavage/methylation domain-containing protein
MRKEILGAHTLIEVIVAIAIIAILSAVVYVIIRPPEVIEDTKYTQALTELAEIGKAIQYYAADNG